MEARQTSVESEVAHSLLQPVETILYSIYESAASHVHSQLKGCEIPYVALVCGKGLQGVAEKLKGPLLEIPYTDIPRFMYSTVSNSTGQLVFGKISSDRHQMDI